MIKKSTLDNGNKAFLKKILPLKRQQIERIGPGLFIEDCNFYVNNYMRKAKEMSGEIKYIDACGARISYYMIDDRLVIKSDRMEGVEYDNVDLRYVIYEGTTISHNKLLYFYYTKIPMPLSNAVHYDGFVCIADKFYPAFREDRMDEDFRLLSRIESACEKREEYLQSLSQDSTQEETL